MNTPPDKPKYVPHITVVVGGGLVPRTPEECRELGLNPNDNPGGAIYLPDDPEVREKHIRKSGDFARTALKRDR